MKDRGAPCVRMRAVVPRAWTAKEMHSAMRAENFAARKPPQSFPDIPAAAETMIIYEASF